MSYYQCPELYQQLLGYTGLVDKIYAAMAQDDYAHLTLTALEVLKETDTMPKFPRQWKSEKQSNTHREEGNKQYVAGKYRAALKLYNKALLFAPCSSQSMLLAYNNRSAVLCKTKNYTASILDINTCLKMKCTNDILAKLTKRKEDCQKNLWRENCPYVSFTENYFRLDSKCHPQIPCVTNDVKIVMDPESNLPIITAAKDIKVGTVIGVETAFTKLLNPDNDYLSCYYCHKMSLNLIPCDNCCFILFCNKECKEKCTAESHKIECGLMEMLQGGFFGPYSRITFRTVIKIKLMCDTWKEFISASKDIGTERMQKSPINQIIDRKYKFSMLNFKDLRPVKYGSMYNYSFMCATLVHELMQVPFFLPCQSEERDEAIRALARMSMNLLLRFYNKIELNNVANNPQIQAIIHLVPNYGYFSFSSKLKHDCNANILPVGLNHQVGLVALHPIKKGTELTICYVDHAYDYMHVPEVSSRERRIQLYRFAQVCHCPICDGTWQSSKTLTDNQRKFYRLWLGSSNNITAQGESVYKLSCEGLAVLHGMSHTKEHRNIYIKFRSLLLVFQYLASRNSLPCN